MHVTNNIINRAILAQQFSGIGVELGVAAGNYSNIILKNSQVSCLYSIDRWCDHHDIKEYFNATELLLSKWGNRSKPLRISFDEALLLFPDQFFDFIYIDGYARNGQENGKTLDDWWPKLKDGGIFSGHDYSNHYPSTILSVDRFCSKHALQLNVTTSGQDKSDQYPSWWIEKPNTTFAPKIIHGSPFQASDKVVMVGNGPSAIFKELGKTIDSFDQVIRFNWYAIKGFEQFVGTKTTLWSTFGRGSRPKDDNEIPPFAVYIHGDKPRMLGVPVPFCYTIPLAFYYDVRDRVKLKSKIPAADRKKDLLPSSGLVVLLWLLEICGINQIHLVGFDHFSKERSSGHHYWVNSAFKKPPEHDGDAECEIFEELQQTQKVIYL